VEADKHIKEVMMAQVAPTARTGQNFAVTDVGLFSELRQFTLRLQKPRWFEAKVFMKQILDLSSAEISFNNLPQYIHTFLSPASFE
jgi:hypothetical protein